MKLSTYAEPKWRGSGPGLVKTSLKREVARAERAAARGDFDLETLDHLRALAFCERESERELAAGQRKGRRGA